MTTTPRVLVAGAAVAVVCLLVGGYLGAVLQSAFADMDRREG